MADISRCSARKITLSEKFSRLRVRLRNPEWRRYGKLLFAGKGIGIALVLGVIGLVVPMLFYEQSLVRADDLSQVKRAFDLNGYVGILYFAVLAASVYVGR